MKNLTNKFDNVKHEGEKILDKILKNERGLYSSIENRRNELKKYREMTRHLENSSISELKEELNVMKIDKMENLNNYSRIYYSNLERELEERNKLLEGTTIPYILVKYDILIENQFEVENLSDTLAMIETVSSIDEFRYKVRKWIKKVRKLEEYLREKHDFKAMKFFGNSEYQIYNDIRNVMISLAIIVELKHCEKILNNNELNYGTLTILAEIMELLNMLQYYSRNIYSKDVGAIGEYLDDIKRSFNEIIGAKVEGSLKDAVLSIVSNVYYA